ncbi:LysR family transcriptional regulator [Agrobacterium vitis]|uniref:HTH-type transcriptional regulator TtuA n=1 Tax=Agrobacterium vitis TaxID=373 RepID=A0ABD6G7Z8_AGRVI|nr:LysR substrate-binding domain-containing protein [Agrobacterium vitis]MUO80169.1 LysR family transcriptional regulator [Agrobacterium vitis]MUO97318.1 LysR family transcriptional regulator [Agrobacterium vitis]MUP03713.1 LysR family transcriptional regulator [Agrobacterium vitis]MUZ82605.1 LysR family transcriptional regulator [Agrobacterium vitis]MVA09946.1 LysR family transcriptional regulator [Agrobacterium vitis]
MKLSKQFPVNALRVFEAVARHNGFTRAAEELGMTQTAVSYQIKLLEDNLGTLLFLRTSRQISLTEAGERLLPKTREGFELLREAVALARHEASEVLEIHSTPTFASHWLARHLGSFQLQHPGIAVRLLRNDGKPRNFVRESGDVGIHIGKEAVPGLICHPILKLSYAPMLSPALAASIGGVRKPADLLKLPRMSSDMTWWADWFRAAGVVSPLPRSTGLDAQGALDLQAGAAIAGHAMAFLSPFYVSDDLTAGRLIQPFDLLLGDDEIYWLVYPPSRRTMPKVKAFHQWLIASLPPLELNGVHTS